MAGRNFRSNRVYNWHVFGAALDGRATIGVSGAPTLITSSTVPSSSPAATQQQSVGIKSITRLATGTYRIRLQDNYTSLYSFRAFFTGAVTGSDIPVDATTVGLSVGTAYQITAVGTATTAANWVTLGVPIGVTIAVGVVFVALTTGTGTQSGAGTVKALTNAGVSAANVIGVPDLMLNSQPFVQGITDGGFITFQTLGTTAAFTGDALAAHGHNFLVKGGQAAASTDAISIKGSAPVIVGKEAATDNTALGGANGGVQTTSAGTPAGTIVLTSAPADPTNGSTMYFEMLLGNSALS